MESTEEKEEREYLTARLLDDCFNLWVGAEFLSSLRNVFGRMPLSALTQLVGKDPILFAPDANISGRVLQAPLSVDAGQFIVYLSPDLLTRSQAYTEFVIAHEFAHVVLGHDETPCRSARKDALEGEQAADRLAESWGFTIPRELDRF